MRGFEELQEHFTNQSCGVDKSADPSIAFRAASTLLLREDVEIPATAVLERERLERVERPRFDFGVSVLLCMRM